MIRLLSTHTVPAIAAALVLGAVQSSASAEFKLTGANILAENFVQSGVVLKEWAQRVADKSGGRIETTIVHGGALLDQGDHLDGLSTGVADFATFFPFYFPGEFKVEGTMTNVIDIWSDEVPDLTGVAVIHAKLHSEFEEFEAEYDQRNIKMLLPVPAEPYVIACTEEVPNLASLQGRKMRSVGKYLPILQAGLGTQTFTVSIAEAYQALSTGMIDCLYTTPGWIYSDKVFEVAPHLLIPGTEKARPQLLATGVVAMNAASFENLPVDLRESIEEVSAEMVDYVGQAMEKAYQDSVDGIVKEGKGTIHYMTEADRNIWADRTDNQLERAASDLTTAGYPGEAIIARYKEIAAAYRSGDLRAGN
ncbi:TRAP transporter substrate-binding protein DctP [Chelativorans sp. Marseille-P2723]|uniref:TRAP transporter substrate-binding protein DctP n=1 Tax=Chelativorans sp. Marseille-P2723 TaxID=2709133 RepID=UPI00156D5606|nr:TRAP transporter substrate-binding protein DctP [Chelativorans sp. Marseille-P2723]